MTSVEKLCLTWTSYQSSMMSTLKHLMSIEDSKDVTLVCEDGSQFTAHKFILSSSSPFFQKMFDKRSPLDKILHSMVYLTNIEASILSNILSFIYLGQVYLQQSELASFMNAAKLLKIVGLSELYTPHSTHPSRSPDARLTPPPSSDINDQQRERPSSVLPQQSEHSHSSQTPMTVYSDFGKNQAYQPIGLLQEQSSRKDIDQDFIEGLLTIKQEPGRGQAGSITSLTPPPEDLPVLEFPVPCSLEEECDLSCSGKVSRITTTSQQKMYFCDQCDYKSTKQYNVKKHKLSVHDKVRYPCNFCKYQATEKGHLKKHLRSVHKDLHASVAAGTLAIAHKPSVTQS